MSYPSVLLCSGTSWWRYFSTYSSWHILFTFFPNSSLKRFQHASSVLCYPSVSPLSTCAFVLVVFILWTSSKNKKKQSFNFCETGKSCCYFLPLRVWKILLLVFCGNLIKKEASLIRGHIGSCFPLQLFWQGVVICIEYGSFLVLWSLIQLHKAHIVFRIILYPW